MVCEKKIRITKTDKMKNVILLSFFTLSLFSAKSQQWGATPEDSLNCLKNLSLYQEYYKNKSYDDALKFWRPVFQICPKSTKSLYTRGAELYSDKIGNTKDATLKELLIDTLLLVYDVRMEHFGEQGYVLGRKGADMLKYRPDAPDKAFAVLEESFKLSGNKIDPATLVYYFKAKYDMFQKGLCEKGDVIALYPSVKAVADYNVLNQKNEKNKENYQKAADNILNIFKPVADCPDLEKVFKPKYEADPQNISLLKDILELFDSKECTSLEFYIEVAKKLQSVEPSAQAAYSIANWYAANDKCGQAVDYYNQAIELAASIEGPGKNDLQLKAATSAAKCYLVLNQYAKSKSLALKMLSIDPGNGEAYMLIGDAYYYGATSVGDNECAKKAGYWAAVDKYQTAISKDGSLSEKCYGKIANAKKQFPKKEDCFFHSINDGASYEVGGWIGETTTVRVQ
jgi:tetratricopeptide (TPR) repeat protein